MKRRSYFVLFFGASLIGARADLVLAPSPSGSSTYTGKEGPFLETSAVSPDERFQEVFAAADFRGPNVALRITDLFFARYAPTPIDVNLSNVALHLSTTSRSPDALSTTFSQNIGVDDRIVFSGPLHFFENGSGPPGSMGEIYNIRVGLQAPFVYDPSAGNLLLDAFNYQTIPTAPPGTVYGLAALRGFFDNGSEVEGPVNSLTGGAGSTALIVGFGYTPIPEPASLWLLLCAVSVFAGIRQVKRSRKEGNICP